MMATTLSFDVQWVTIANRALLSIGSDEISSLGDGSYEAGFCTQLLPQALDTCYSVYHWRSGLKRAQLPPLAEAPAYGFSYQFELPADFARLKAVECDGEYEMEGRVILTDSTYCNVSYTAIPSNPSFMTPDLRDLVVKQLAYLLSVPILKNDAISNRLMDEYTKALSLMISQDKVTHYQEDTVSPWYDESR